MKYVSLEGNKVGMLSGTWTSLNLAALEKSMEDKKTP